MCLVVPEHDHEAHPPHGAAGELRLRVGSGQHTFCSPRCRQGQPRQHLHQGDAQRGTFPSPQGLLHVTGFFVLPRLPLGVCFFPREGSSCAQWSPWDRPLPSPASATVHHPSPLLGWAPTSPADLPALQLRSVQPFLRLLGRCHHPSTRRLAGWGHASTAGGITASKVPSSLPFPFIGSRLSLIVTFLFFFLF